MSEETLFVAALEMSHSADRQAFLEKACGGDLALRDRLCRLLAADEQTMGILDVSVTPPGEAGDPWLKEDLGPREAGVGRSVAGRYELIEAIGEGGMGKVWLAEQTEPVRRKVALKLIRPGVGSKSVLARFSAERQALALMDHPNIAKVLDGGEAEDGRPYFVMEYVEGVPLTQYCDDARLSIPKRLELFIGVCQAVQHAHAKGIIHRDLKPSNVLVATYDGAPVPKVIDFGVAKSSGPRPADWRTLTEHGQLIGTPLYMSPEQAEVGGEDVDTRSDVYALGVILYELLTGSTPIDVNADVGFFELLRLIREQEPATPSQRLSTSRMLPEIAAHRATEPARLTRMTRGELDWIVTKALEKDRSRRYQTAFALAADLQNFLKNGPVSACPPTVGYRLRKFVRRNKGPVLAVSLVALALVGGIIGTTWNLFRATDALAEARRSEREATDRMFTALLNQARAGRFSRQMGQRLESLDAIARAARIRPDDRLRDEAIAALALPDVRRVPAVHAPPPGSIAVAYGREYSLAAHLDAQGVIHISGINDSREVQWIAQGPVASTNLHFSPDDRFLLGLGNKGELSVWRVADGRPAIAEELRGCTSHSFSPDGRFLAVGQPGRASCHDLEAGREVANWRLPAVALAMAFHPNGRDLAVGLPGLETAAVYNSRDGALLTELPLGATTGQVVAWHPDGRRLAVSGNDPRIQIWDVAERRMVATLTGHVQRVTDLTFHTGGGLLASYSWDGVLRLWDPSTGRSLLQLPLAIDARLRFSSSGRWLGVARHGEQVELLEVTPSQVYRTLVSGWGLGRGGAYSPADISPDGRLLAVGTLEAVDSGVRLWDLRGGRELAALPTGTNFVCFDGRWRLGEGDGDGWSPGPGAAILTGGTDGLLRWPVTSEDPSGQRLRLGSPRQLSSSRRAWFTRRPDGVVLGAATEEGGSNTILDMETGGVRWELGVHPEWGEVRAVSGDGRWAASSGWHSDRVRLWDLGTGRMAREWVLGKRNFVFFSPDSRCLIISREDEFSFWDLATLRPIRQLRREVAHFPGHVAFSPDGRLMALEMAPAVIHVIDHASYRTVARLEDPYGDRATWQGFTPDGAGLVVVSAYAGAIHVWDLREVRARLKPMGLDWNWPEFEPEPPAGPVTVAVAIDPPAVDLNARRKIERLRRAVEARPNSAYACNDLAWAYLTVPEPLGDVKAALPLAEEAVRRSPANVSFRNTLGVAYYRAGRYREAVETLQPNLQVRGHKQLAFDLYFLAMSHHRLGATAHARDLHEWASRWVLAAQPGLSANDLAELTAIRAEAGKLLGIGVETGPSRAIPRHPAGSVPVGP